MTIDRAGLDALVSTGVEETDRIDFKRDMYAVGDAGIREIARDITAFANARGGRIFVGIDQSRRGTAAAVVGVLGGGHAERIERIVQVHVHPPLRSVEIEHVPLDEARAVVIVSIPQSGIGPHMVTFDEENRFWIRDGRARRRMKFSEIEDAFLRRLSAHDRVTENLDRRLAELEDAALLSRRPKDWALILQAQPAVSVRQAFDARRSDLRALLSTPPHHPEGAESCRAGDARPSLRGFTAQHAAPGAAVDARLELGRDLYLEYLETEYRAEALGIPSTVVLLKVYSFVELFRQTLAMVEVQVPAVFRLALLNLPGKTTLHVPNWFRRESPDLPWQHERMVVPSVYSEDPDKEVLQVTKELNDGLWNAFGYEHCVTFRRDGRLQQSRSVPGPVDE